MSLINGVYTMEDTVAMERIYEEAGGSVYVDIGANSEGDECEQK